MSYKLINPYIDGDFSIEFQDATPLAAAHKCWKQVSKLLSNDVPVFAFTLKNMSGGSLHHFKVSEKKNKDKIHYTLEELGTIVTEEELANLNNLSTTSKTIRGGHEDSEERRARRERRRYDDDDDDDDDSFSDLYRKNKYKSYPITPLMPAKYMPFTYWWYYPSCYRLDYVYIPTFIAPINPYVTIVTSFP